MSIGDYDQATADRIEWGEQERFACPLCGGNRYAKVGILVGEHQFFACEGCTLVFLDPRMFTKMAGRIHGDIKAASGAFVPTHMRSRP